MVTVCPATVRVQVRGPPLFAALVKATVPLPVPLEPPVIESQLVVVDADQPHPAAVVTEIGVPAPPDAAAGCVVGATV